jgi:DNA-binding NtrC family response regulator
MALVRLAAADDALIGAPSDPRFGDAAPPRVVLLGLAGDFEPELEFARRVSPRLRESAWILVLDPRLAEEARRLFDSISARFVGYPPEAAALRTMIRDATEGAAASPLPLSQRAGRDALATRFARWFADLELPELLRALDPRLADVPVLVRGEPGTGRGTLARYIHAFGGTSDGALVHLPCADETASEALLSAMAAETRGPRAERAYTLWLDEVDRLAPDAQRRLAGWLEYGPPAGSLPALRRRWIATAGEEGVPGRGIEPALLQALAGISLRIPPLRERTDFLPNLVRNTADAWCRARGEAPRRFGEDALAALEEYPWPGNLRELEAVVSQSLAAGTANPLGPEDLRLGGTPLGAGAIGALLDEAMPEEPAPVVPEEPIEIEGIPLDEEEPIEIEAIPLDEEEPIGAEPAAEPEVAVQAGPGAAEESRAPQPPPASTTPISDAALRRLADAVSHEVRNPLTAIRTFADLLPERYGDPEFRTRFARHVTAGVERVEGVVDALAQLATLGPPDRKPVDVSALLEEVLDARRQRIRDRHLLVLKELDPSHPIALCDPEQLRFAFDAMLDRAIDMLPDRGDLYLASRRHATGLRGGPSVRVLLRLQLPGRGAPPGQGLSPAENSLGLAIAEAVARAQGGSVAIGAADPAETVVLMDLPAAQ